MYKPFESVAIFLSVLGRTLYDSIRLQLRNSLHLLPISVRGSILKKSKFLPLWLLRIIVNISTSPIGDEIKWIHKIEQNSWRGVWIVPDLTNLLQAEHAAVNNDLVVLYTHGGGYCFGHAQMYMETFQLIINHLRDKHNIRASILSLEYSLSPENVWPKARDEAMEAYRYLVDTLGIPSSKIIFAGESAGGHLAATMLLTLKAQANKNRKILPLPAGAALLAPWVDLTVNQPGFAAYPDDMLSPEQVEEYGSYFIPNYNNLDEDSRNAIIHNPLISPLYGDFRDTCPIFLAYGEKEMLRTSIENFEVKLDKDGCDVTILKGKNALHIWLVLRLMASTKQVYDRDCKIFIDWMASICKKNKII